jgi:GAF domain-containing protein
MDAADDTSQKELINLLAAIATDITTALDEEALAIAMQQSIERLVDVEYSGLFFYDAAIGRLRLVYAAGFTHEDRVEAERTAMERHPGWVFRNRKVLHVPDTQADPEQRSQTGRRSFDVRSRLHFPILYREECVGVVALASPYPNRFTDHHMSVLSFVSSMAGVVHANLRHIRAIMAQLDIVRRQKAEIRDLSTPILMVGRGALLLPIVGRMDEARVLHTQEKLLHAIAERRARAVILDLTGMDAAEDGAGRSPETGALEALLRIARASALMGTRCVVSGITSRAALSMARLDVPIRASDIFGTVETALASVLRADS